MSRRRRALARERIAQLRLMRSVERVLEKKVAASIKRQAARLAGEYERVSTLGASSLAAEQELLSEAFRRYGVSTARLFGSRVLEGKKNESPYMVGLKDWIEKRALDAARNVTQTTIRRAKRIIQAGIDDGEGVPVIARALRATLGQTAAARAFVIARTEVHNAAMEGSMAAAYSLNQAVMKTWVSAADDRTRDDHAAADGQTVRLDEQFDVGGEGLDRPGDGSDENAINCRCVMVFSTEQ